MLLHRKVRKRGEIAGRERRERAVWREHRDAEIGLKLNGNATGVRIGRLWWEVFRPATNMTIFSQMFC
jgi:hypothetical protein